MEKNGQDGRATLRDVFSLARDGRIGGHELRLWLLYRSYDGGEGSWPGDDVLAAHMGKSVRSVEGYRARLIEMGFLTKEFRGPKPAIYRAVLPEAPQDSATLETSTPAGFCDARAKAPQKAPQDSAVPPTPPIEDEYGNTVVGAPDVVATRSVCTAMLRPWDHSLPVADWVERIASEFPDVDVAAVARDAADWLGTEDARQRKYKSPSAFLRKQVKRAADRGSHPRGRAVVRVPGSTAEYVP